MTATAKRVEGPAVAYDEVRTCPVCGEEVAGVGEVKCGGHFIGYSFQNLRRIPAFVTLLP